jgi:hypothetical protein
MGNLPAISPNLTAPLLLIAAGDGRGFFVLRRERLQALPATQDAGGRTRMRLSSCAQPTRHLLTCASVFRDPHRWLAREIAHDLAGGNPVIAR